MVMGQFASWPDWMVERRKSRKRDEAMVRRFVSEMEIRAKLLEMQNEVHREFWDNWREPEPAPTLLQLARKWAGL